MSSFVIPECDMFYRMIRITRTGRDTPGSRRLALRNFEVFGRLLEGDNEVIVNLDQERPLNGVIQFLGDECGGNVCGKDVVYVMGNAEAYGSVWYATDQSSGSYISVDEPDQWLILDFKCFRVSPTGYLVQSWNLRSLVIEASDDGLEWTEIDRREDVSYSVLRFEPCTFEIGDVCDFHRWFRMRQIRSNWDWDNKLWVRRFDLFGRVDPPI